jgi:signal transduction histidine kinase
LDLQEVNGTYLSQLLIFQVAREAMTNASLHAQANHVLVRLWNDEGLSRLIVADDGTGFDRTGVDQRRHFGLQLMVERVEAASGRIAIDSRLGEGTTVVAVIPPDIAR